MLALVHATMSCAITRAFGRLTASVRDAYGGPPRAPARTGRRASRRSRHRPRPHRCRASRARSAWCRGAPSSCAARPPGHAIEHEVAGAGDPAAERDHLGVHERDHVRDPERQVVAPRVPRGARVRVARLRGLADALGAQPVAPRAAVVALVFVLVLRRRIEQRAARKRRRQPERVAQQPRAGRLRFEAADLAARADEAAVRADRVVAELARAHLVPERDAARRDDAAADARAQREQDEVARPLADAVNVLAERRAARIVRDEHRTVRERLAHARAERDVLPSEVRASSGSCRSRDRCCPESRCRCRRRPGRCRRSLCARRSRARRARRTARDR